jgi:GTP pyrophosphokinase
VNVDDLLARTRQYLPEDKVTVVKKAYLFAETAHEGQVRKSGDPFISHPLDAAMTVAGLQLDATAVAAALLHDVQEDCGIPNADLAKRFGRDVARLVDGATKLERITWRPPTDGGQNPTIQAENLRKMFLAMAEDVRVVIIKLADRLHNMRTLEALREEKRQRIAQETMEIYAPLASRLGIWQIARELEDLSFKHLQPDRYNEIIELLAAKRVSRERYIAQVERMLRDELAKEGIEAEVQGRAKHAYSIYQKFEKYEAQGKSFSEIYDLMALRVLVGTVADCYSALGIIHGRWHPIPGQFDDYIASPKESLYQSLHTTVLGLGGRPLEVQIRTHEMHRLAEYGVAAHWRYKEGGRRERQYEQRLSWIRQLLEWQREMSADDDFVESVKTDFFQDQVFVYTPKGEVKDLPTGSTPIDFAFRIHTDVGYHCIGGRVNGRLVSLKHQLQNGDVVEILTSKSSRGPSRDWLNPNLGYLQTSHAREKVRQWFKKQQRQENIEKGSEMLDRELRRLGLAISEAQDELLRQFRQSNWEDFLATLGYGGISLHQVAQKLTQLLSQKEAPVEEEAPPEALPGPVYTSAVRVLGTGDLLTQLARCCNPVPGDGIIGYVTRSRGVTVHRRDCSNVLQEDERERLVDVEWGRSGHLYPVSVRIEAWDRVGLMRDISTLVAEEHVNMVAVRTQEHPDSTVSVFLTLETTGVEQLSRVLTKMESVSAVLFVRRTMDTRRSASKLQA